MQGNGRGRLSLDHCVSLQCHGVVPEGSAKMHVRKMQMNSPPLSLDNHHHCYPRHHHQEQEQEQPQQVHSAKPKQTTHDKCHQNSRQQKIVRSSHHTILPYLIPSTCAESFAFLFFLIGTYAFQGTIRMTEVPGMIVLCHQSGWDFKRKLDFVHQQYSESFQTMSDS